MKTGKKQKTEIPNGWEEVSLGDVCEMERGYSYRSNEIIKTEKTNREFITIDNFSKEGGLKNGAETIYLKDNVEIDDTYFIKKDDILIANTDMTKGFIIGAPVIMDPQKKKLVYSMDLTKLKLNPGIYNKYLYYILKMSRIRREMKMCGQGTNVLHLNHNLSKKIKFVKPADPNEQKAIAKVLSEVDDTIDKVNEAISKTERIKEGMMNEFFNSKLELTPLVSYCKEDNDIVAGPFGSNLKVSDYKKEGIPIIRLQNIERNLFIEKDIKFISKEKAEELKYHSFIAGDIVLAKLGIPIGKTCIVPNTLKKGIVVADVVRIRISDDKADKNYIEYALNSRICINQLNRQTIGSTRPRVNLNHVRNLMVPKILRTDQEKVAKTITLIDTKLSLEKQKKKKLENIKQYLMNNLLTGKQRIDIKKVLGNVDV